MKLKMMAKSDIGTVRSVNEDCCGIYEEDGLAIVCDGMGGHNAGASASRLAVATIRYMYLFLDRHIHFQITRDLIARNLNIATRLVGSIRLANRNLYNKSLLEPQFRGMGTTVSALAIRDGTAIIVHVGDSRIYRFRQDRMDQLTEDHTWINELIQDQEIDYEQAKKLEKQNVITRALGQSGAIKIDIGIEPVQQGDLFLICSDGLTKALTDEEINRIVLFNKSNLDHTLLHLIDTANMKDGSDNITAALIRVEELESDDTQYQPTYLTLGTEGKQTIRLEDKILKRELYNRTTYESSENLMNKFIKEKYVQLSGIIASFILVIVLGVYVFSNQLIKKNSAQTKESHTESASLISNDQTQTRNNSPLNNDEMQQNLPTNTAAFPDSVINRLITASFENQKNIASVPQSDSRSLQQDVLDCGSIYLIGLEKLNRIESTALFVNGKYWGKTEDYLRKRLILGPGLYTIMIRDSNNKILFLQKNIKVSVGDVKAIEYRNR